jgi:ribosomal protein S12 methylthiotransferase accessory factor
MRPLLRRFFRASEDTRFRETLARARAVQERGYDIAFSFLPRFPDTPLLYVCDGRSGSDRLLGVGFDYASRADAFAKSLSETLERTLWREDMLYWNEHAIRAKPEELGADALSLKHLAGFSSAQRERDPVLRMSPDATFLFSRAVRLDDGSPCYVPAQLVSGAAAAKGAGEPLLRVPNSNGLATHETFDEAARRGILELIERDAFMITFSNMLVPPRIALDKIRDEQARIRIESLRRTDFEVDLLLLPTDMPFAVVCCVLRDRTAEGPALVVGARAHEDAGEAITGALTEALGVYYLARAMGRYKQPLPAHPLRALDRIAYWGKPEHTAQLSWLWSGPTVSPPPHTRRMSARRLAREAQRCGVSLAAITMTPPKLADLGLVSVCVTSPELQPLNLDEAPAYLGGARLSAVPQALGYTTRDAPPPYPHPFP